ncbi:hypothetical protein QQP08_006681 [Theobroma cacao]|nr:hypothetical protein QQP08_006681 [Theobroma cacao]
MSSFAFSNPHPHSDIPISHCPSASHLQLVNTLSPTLPISPSKSLALATCLRFSLPNLHPIVPIAIIHRHRTFSRSPL